MKTHISELVGNDGTMFSTDGLNRLSTDELVGHKLVIDAIHPYEKDGENKILFRFTMDGGSESFFTFTGAMNIVKKLTNECVLKAIALGDTIECVLFERPSQTDARKTVYDLR